MGSLGMMGVGGGLVSHQFNSSTVSTAFPITPQLNAYHVTSFLSVKENGIADDDIDTGIFNEHSMSSDDPNCYYPYRTTSKGLWREEKWGEFNLNGFSIVLFGFQVIVIFAVTRTLQLFLKPLGIPPIFGQILGGIILGDSHLGTFVGSIIGLRNRFATTGELPDAFVALFPKSSVSILNNFGTIGFMLFQFLLGVKMDPSMIWNSGRKATAIGISTLVVPLIMGLCTTYILAVLDAQNEDSSKLGKQLFSSNLHFTHEMHMLFYVSGVQSMSSFPVVASILTDLKMLNSDLGRIALSSSMVSEFGNTIVTLIMNNWKLVDTKENNDVSDSHTHTKHFSSLWKPICKDNVASCASFACVIFVFFVVLVVPRAMVWVIKQTPKRKLVRNNYIVLILIGVFISGLISVAIGQQALFGPFIFGLAIPDGPPIGTTLVTKLDSIVSGMLVPIFITVSGLRTIVPPEDSNRKYTKILVIMMSVSIVGKSVGTLVCCLLFRMPIRDALAFTFIMNAKGIVELSVYNIWREVKVLNDHIFTYMIIYVAICTAIVPLFVKFLYDPNSKYARHVKRTILHTKMGTQLGVLACINQEENVPTIIKLLQASNPTREMPLCVYVLHLVELGGRTAPKLISHKKGKSKKCNPSESEHITNAFQNYEEQYQGAVTVQTFTSISPYRTMHDDICSLALTKCAAFIIIPFHREWTVDGMMGTENLDIRNLNQKVIEMAPCSVGILVDRGQVTVNSHNMKHSSYRVAVLFLGGADDREALTFAKRMSENTNVYVTVVHLIASDDQVNMGVRDEWGAMLDSEVVKDFKYSTMSNEQVMYREEEVIDGGQTAWMIRSMEDEHDLIIVGRRHGLDSPITSGLTEWSEYPELGVMGDMLASSDVKAGVSVLVVQQMPNAQ